MHAGVACWTGRTAARHFIAGEFNVPAIRIAIFPTSGTVAVATQPRSRQDETSYDNVNQGDC